MSGRVVVERREDLAKDDLRMMIRNEKNGDHEGRKRDHEEEKENLDSRRVVVKEEEEKERREEERRERRREEEKRKDGGGGRRVVRLDKSNGNERAESEENEERVSKRPSPRNGREAEESAPPKKKSKEPTPEAAEGGEKRYLLETSKQTPYYKPFPQDVGPKETKVPQGGGERKEGKQQRFFERGGEVSSSPITSLFTIALPTTPKYFLWGTISNFPSFRIDSSSK